jgi:hypothetical protein
MFDLNNAKVDEHNQDLSSGVVFAAPVDWRYHIASPLISVTVATTP